MTIAQLKREAAAWRRLAREAWKRLRGNQFGPLYGPFLCHFGPNHERLALFRPSNNRPGDPWWYTSDGSGATGRVFACLFLAEMCDDDITERRRTRGLVARNYRRWHVTK